MAHTKIYPIVLAGIIIALHTAVPARAGAAVDHSAFGMLLRAHVIGGRVDYRGFKQDEQRLDDYLAGLALVDPAKLDRPERMAFYINAYNAWTIKLILGHYPGVASIKDLGSLFTSPWKKAFVKINGETVTLDHIEHDILRPEFKDPRVHFAINCASKSCPPLLNEPYTGADLDRQLDGVATAFINDPASNYVKGDILYASRVFKWFGEDFGDDIPGYIGSYAHGDLARRIKAAGSALKVKYLDYDWSLNDV